MPSFAKVRDIYDLVCAALMEPSGPRLGLFTEAEVLNHINTTISDLLQGGAFVRQFSCLPIIAFQEQYNEPDEILNVESTYVREKYIPAQSTFDIAENNYQFQTVLPGNPTCYREDQQMPRKMTLQPKPNWNGPQVELLQGQLFYGTISEVAAGVSLDITVTEPFYGTLSGEYDSATYLDSGTPFWGTISVMATSDSNLTMIGVSQPSKLSLTMDDWIEQVPRSFGYYIRYGVLAKMFSTNSELKDLRRGKYCQQRFSEGIRLAAAINTDTLYYQTRKTIR